jgi:calcium-dependent protein kinase
MYCHKRGIVHRDLKPENILFDSKKPGATIKVIDFGASAKMSNQEKLTKRIGTPFYVAPEVLAARYDEKCDIWSIGVILYTLLCGYPPFFANSEVEVLKKVKAGTYTFDCIKLNNHSERLGKSINLG